MHAPQALPFAAPQAAPNEITAVSWNLHKGRSPLGFT
ncbi:MAG: endonuclease, partial [Burkholderia gladioli]